MELSGEGRNDGPADVRLTGTVVAGRYEIDHVVGTGGMGVVYSAMDRTLRRRVAIKLLYKVRSEEDEELPRFQREARALAALESDHVARVLDVGALPSGERYLVLEYLFGSDLHRVLATRGRLPIRQAVDYVLQACDAIAEAHAVGIVHRDLKPENLFLARKLDGTELIKVLDFGIAKLEDEADSPHSTLTRPGKLLGSPRYMSPEQVRSSPSVGSATDIWALGVVLYELIAGRPMFHQGSLTAVSAAIVADPPPSLRARVPEVPPELEETILRCVEKDPAKRFMTIAALAARLAPFASRVGRRCASRIAVLSGEAPAEPTTVTFVGPVAAKGAGAIAPRAAAAADAHTYTRARIGVALLGIGAVGVALALIVSARRTAASNEPRAVASVAAVVSASATNAPVAPDPAPQPVSASAAPPEPSAAIAASNNGPVVQRRGTAAGTRATPSASTKRADPKASSTEDPLDERR